MRRRSEIYFGTGADIPDQPKASRLAAQKKRLATNRAQSNVPTSPKSDDSRPVANSNLQTYREAMRVANAPAAKGKGKDVLGPGSPWKLNLYDDDNDGRWDRGKLDYNRDDIDDEKWNFKQGHWEKDAGSQIWDGSNWKKP